MKFKLNFVGSYTSPLNHKNQQDILIIGKSNAGKSSIINACFQTKLARISKKPGKTLNLNYYAIEGTPFHLVDSYGYGYSKISKEEKTLQSDIIENYFRDVRALKLVILVLNADNFMSSDDELMLDYLLNTKQTVENPFKILLVVNKIDKTNQSERYSIEQKIQKIDSEDCHIVYHCAKNSDHSKKLLQTLSELTDKQL